MPNCADLFNLVVALARKDLPPPRGGGGGAPPALGPPGTGGGGARTDPPFKGMGGGGGRVAVVAEPELGGNGVGGGGIAVVAEPELGGNANGGGGIAVAAEPELGGNGGGGGGGSILTGASFSSSLGADCGGGGVGGTATFGCRTGGAGNVTFAVILVGAGGGGGGGGSGIVFIFVIDGGGVTEGEDSTGCGSCCGRGVFSGLGDCGWVCVWLGGRDSLTSFIAKGWVWGSNSSVVSKWNTRFCNESFPWFEALSSTCSISLIDSCSILWICVGDIWEDKRFTSIGFNFPTAWTLRDRRSGEAQELLGLSPDLEDCLVDSGRTDFGVTGGEQWELLLSEKEVDRIICFPNEQDRGLNSFLFSYSSMSNLSLAKFIRESRVVNNVSPEKQMKQNLRVGNGVNFDHCKSQHKDVRQHYPVDAYCCYLCTMVTQYWTCASNHFA